MKLAVLALLTAIILSPRAQPLPPLAAPPTEEDYRTERLVQATTLPPRNLYDLYPRLRGQDPASVRRVVGDTRGWRVGARREFWVGNLETHEYTRRAATLHHVSESAYWWVEEGGPFTAEGLEAAAGRFDSAVRRNRETFGSEWNPGVDNDSRIVVLVVSIAGAGGYYSSADEYPRSINPYSNQHEMIYINSQPGDPFFDSTLAHEFQHMIHWNEHANQDVWLNEGMAEYAVELNGYTEGLPEEAHAAAPDTQLNTWTDQPSTAGAHYGQSYRFMSYLAGRYGARFMSRILDAPGAGLDAVDRAIREAEPGASLHKVYGEWLAANLFVRNGSGVLGYRNELTPVRTEPASTAMRSATTVRQWGADYYAREDNGAWTLTFKGAPRVRLVGNEPRSGAYQWYSNRGDLLNSRLTRPLDLRRATRATLEMDLWYEIEEHFDYAYVDVSADGGRTWRTLPGRNTTNENPNGNNLGNGLTGNSNGWTTESFDLSPFAGREVLLRVEYVTDDGYNAQGIAVDGVRVPEVGFSDDSETENGWESEGWVRTNNWLPARYRLLVLDPDSGGSYVEVPVGADGAATATFERGEGKPPVVVVSGAAERTTQESAYELRIEPLRPGSLGVIGGRASPGP